MPNKSLIRQGGILYKMRKIRKHQEKKNQEKTTRFQFIYPVGKDEVKLEFTTQQSCEILKLCHHMDNMAWWDTVWRCSLKMASCNQQWWLFINQSWLSGADWVRNWKCTQSKRLVLLLIQSSMLGSLISYPTFSSHQTNDESVSVNYQWSLKRKRNPNDFNVASEAELTIVRLTTVVSNADGITFFADQPKKSNIKTAFKKSKVLMNAKLQWRIDGTLAV